MLDNAAMQDSSFDRQLLNTLLAVRQGNWSVRLSSDFTGVPGKIADVLNDIIDMNERVAREFDRVSRVVGREGKLMQRATVRGLPGGWETVVQSINTLIDDPSTGPLRGEREGARRGRLCSAGCTALDA
ncbi:MAG: hypothetical protein KIS79_08475 [Burkholderiales bacterium]|nr:hypothetical protein [Burkholderiales bacterium]